MTRDRWLDIAVTETRAITAAVLHLHMLHVILCLKCSLKIKSPTQQIDLHSRTSALMFTLHWHMLKAQSAVNIQTMNNNNN